MLIATNLQDALLNVLRAVDDVANDEDDVDHEEGDQGGVAEVLRVDVGVRVAQLQGGRGEEQVVAVVAVSEAPGVKYSGVVPHQPLILIRISNICF